METLSLYNYWNSTVLGIVLVAVVKKMREAQKLEEDIGSDKQLDHNTVSTLLVSQILEKSQLQG